MTLQTPKKAVHRPAFLICATGYEKLSCNYSPLPLTSSIHISHSSSPHAQHMFSEARTILWVKTMWDILNQNSKLPLLTWEDLTPTRYWRRAESRSDRVSSSRCLWCCQYVFLTHTSLCRASTWKQWEDDSLNPSDKLPSLLSSSQISLQQKNNRKRVESLLVSLVTLKMTCTRAWMEAFLWSPAPPAHHQFDLPPLTSRKLSQAECASWTHPVWLRPLVPTSLSLGQQSEIHNESPPGL